VNYQPDFVENSEESYAKRTFSNMAEGNFPLNDHKKTVLFNDQKENENTTNAHFFNRGKCDITDPNIILDDSNPSISVESHNYERLKSTR
jgi:hypothetical protein